MAPTLSVLIFIGNWICIPIDSIVCLMNKSSFATSEIAKYSASVDDSVTLLPDLDFQAMGAPQKYMI
jgi:hypothetical protein